MIAFTKLGTWGRFANQLFQYAYLRATAERLRVPFYCPSWLGDAVFDLKDKHLRASKPSGITKKYRHPRCDAGFHACALSVEEGTDIAGNFQSPKYFNRSDSLKWFTFKENAVFSVRQKYQHIDFCHSCGVHLRFGDMERNPKYIIPPRRYYKDAFSRLKIRRPIVVFSDEIERAKATLQPLRNDAIYIEGNREYEDLYLMSQCRDLVCSISTLSWWGAWLNNHENKTIIAPVEWIRPGAPIKNTGLQCADWTLLSIYRPVIDHYITASLMYRFYR